MQKEKEAPFVIKRGCSRSTCMPCKKIRAHKTRIFVAITEREREILRQILQRGRARWMAAGVLEERDSSSKEINDGMDGRIVPS